MQISARQTPPPLPPGPSPTAGDSNTGMILSVSGLMMGLSFAIVGLRIWVRQLIIKTLGFDDVVMIAALIAAIGSMVCFVGECETGAGKHFWDLDFTLFPAFLRWQYIHGILLVVGISLVKISIGFFLLRLIQNKWYRRIVIFTQVFIALFTISCVCTLVLQCVPPEATFALVRPPTAKCFDQATFTNIGIFNGAVNITTDVVFVLLPIPMILKLQVNNRTKATLIVALSLGIFACIAAIVRVYLGAHIFENADFTWSNAFFLWNTAELHAGILAASLPTLRPLFKSLLETTSRHMRSHGYTYGSRYGPGGRKSGSGALGLGSSSTNGGGGGITRSGTLRSVGYRRHSNAADDLYALNMMDSLGGRHNYNKSSDTNVLGMGLGYNARITSREAATTLGGGDSSEECILPPPPAGAITKRTEVVVQES
ncbi:hypothetical protein PG993_011821 [Apiospora rasikravindrae]|uniref:Rhodopsin domain-containing protein n=1 Tax=Apiospora rasikravindrae TaxID=990691 RepID=A0ABR1S0T0_9PEZI